MKPANRTDRTNRATGPIALLVLALALAAAGPGAAAAEEGWGYELANELMSPYCPGRALAECPSPQAGELRQWILDQERAGVPRSVAMKITGHQTESVYVRYAIVCERDIAEALGRLSRSAPHDGPPPPTRLPAEAPTPPRATRAALWTNHTSSGPRSRPG